MCLDTCSYLPGDILTKVDRAAMHVGLETRVPFLDHRIIEFAWQLPLSMKIKDNGGKRIVRSLLHRYLPDSLIDRPKAGFAVPLDGWLRGPLREWAEAMLSREYIERKGFLNPAPVVLRWNEHIAGQRNWGHHLWDVLIFHQWLERQGL